MKKRIKNCLILLVSFILVASACSSVMIASAATSTLFTCDFDSMTEAAGTTATSAVMKSVGWNGSTGDLGTIVSDDDGGKCLYWTTSYKAGFDLGRNITSGTVKISFKFKRDANANESASYYVGLTNEAGSTSTPSSTTNRGFLSCFGSAVQASASGGTAGSGTSVGIAKNTWYTLTYEIDVTNWQFDCYVNETTVCSDRTLGMTNRANGIRSVILFMNASANFYVDDFVVTHVENGSNVDADFALGNLQIEKDGTEIANPVTAGDEINVTVKALNTAGGAKKITLVYASYNGGELVDVKLLPVSVAASSNVQKIVSEAYTVKSGITTTETKAFIWDNAANLTPLAASVKYPK